LQVIQSILTSVEEILCSKRYMVLMLIWQGSWFAYRYTQPPHLEQQELSSGVKSFEEIIFTTKTIGNNIVSYFSGVLVNKFDGICTFLNIQLLKKNFSLRPKNDCNLSTICFSFFIFSCSKLYRCYFFIDIRFSKNYVENTLISIYIYIFVCVLYTI